MPTYEYVCSACGHRLEVFQSFSEDPLVECEQCGGHLRRVFHPVGILFKGSGFYSTDARSKSSRSNGAKEQGSKGAESGSSGSTGKEGSGGESGGRGSGSKGSSKPSESKSQPKGGGSSEATES